MFSDFPPTLASLALEEIKRYAGNEAVQQDTLYLRRCARVSHHHIDDNANKGYAPQWRTVKNINYTEYAPALLALQATYGPPSGTSYLNYEYSSGGTERFAVWTNLKDLVSKVSVANVSHSATLEEHLKNSGLLKGSSKESSDAVRQVIEEDITIDVARLRQIAAQAQGAVVEPKDRSHLSKAGRLLAQRRTAGANREVA